MKHAIDSFALDPHDAVLHNPVLSGSVIFVLIFGIGLKRRRIQR